MNYTAAFRAAVAASCREWDMTEEQVLGEGRHNREAMSRHCVAFAMRAIGASFSEIGSLMRGRHHGTAMNSVKVANQLIDYDSRFRERAIRIRDAAKDAHRAAQIDSTASAMVLGEVVE